MVYNYDLIFLMPDIDECDIGLNDCASSICYNSNGSYDCGSRSEPNINLIQPGNIIYYNFSDKVLINLI